jgi:hypothetical protein
MSISPKKLGYMPDICPCCKQSCTYIVAIDRGAVELMRAIARYVQMEGVNKVHIRDDLEKKLKWITSVHTGNLSKPRMHGLIARYKENGERKAGYYLLTKKGSDFLKGASIPRYAIASKVESHQVGYFAENDLKCTINDFNEIDEPRWVWSNVNINDNGTVETVPQASLL